MLTPVKISKLPVAEQASIYRMTPYQYICTAPYINIKQTVGKSFVVDSQTTIIKPLVVSTKIK